MSSCPICITKYNKTARKQVTCICDFSACSTCVRTYILGSTQEPHCMHCRNKWNNEFMKTAIGTSFVNGDLQKHQCKLLTEQALSRREENLQGAINLKEDRKDKEEIKELKKTLDAIRIEAEAIQTNIIEIENRIRVRNGERPIRYYNRRTKTYNIPPDEAIAVEAPPATKKFIMPCQNADCKGMLNSQYFCQICEKHTCSHCLEIKTEGHVCNKDTVATAATLKRESKPCPKCGVRISKIDGCDQMWCVECKTPFSWSSGTIETGKIHNPHYFTYARENGIDLNEPQQPQNECVPEDRMQTYVSDWLGAIYRKNRDNTKTKSLSLYSDRLLEYIRFTYHIRFETCKTLEEKIKKHTEDKTFEYLYILGEISKETLSKKLMANYKLASREKPLYEIYQAMILMRNQLISDFYKNIITPENGSSRLSHLQHFYNIVNRYMAYFNAELIKSRLENNSFAELDMFIDWTRTTQKYKTRAEMETAIQQFMDVYNANSNK